MMLHKLTAITAPVTTAVLAVGAIAVAGTAHAGTGSPDIGYRTDLNGNSVVTTLTDGVFEIAGDTVKIKDTAGDTVLGLPLSFQQDGLLFPLPASVTDDGHTLTLTAVKDVAAARPALQPVASNLENQRAMQSFASQFGIATAIGSFVGLALGAAVGLIGLAGGGVSALATVPTFATIGAIIGTLVVGGPTLIIAGIDLINTLNSAPGTTKWVEPTDPQPAAPQPGETP